MKVSECTLIKPLFCSRRETVINIAKALRKNKQRRMIVVNDKGYPEGIVSTSDINNRVVAEGKDPSKAKASDIMTSPLFLVCDVNEDINDVFSKMVRHESYFCPVTKGKKLYAVLTYGELVKSVRKVLKNGKGKA